MTRGPDAAGPPPPDDLLEERALGLVAQGLFVEAGKLLMSALPLGAGEMPDISRTQRRRALKAAVFLARGGEHQMAARLFLAAREPDRAVAVLEQSGDEVGAAVAAARNRAVLPGSIPPTPDTPDRLRAAGQVDLAIKSYAALGRLVDAATLARQHGRTAKAAHYFLEAGLPFEAAGCHFEAGDLVSCLDAVVRVPRTHPSYRVACAEAVLCAEAVDVVGLDLENLLPDFIRTGPLDDAEVEVFVVLAGLYLRKGFNEDAREVLGKTLRNRPGTAAAEKLLAQLGGAPETTALADLPDLPPLPPPPRVPTRRMAGPPPPLPPAVGRADDPHLAPGVSVAGRYVLGERLGRGGMSVVFQATDLELGETVALKFLIRGLEPGDAVARLKRELKLSRQLVHPNIVRLFDLGAFGDLPYISMELLAGMDLARRLAAEDPLPLPSALTYLIEACDALEAAHAKGIVHRDIKPSNLFLTKEGTLKVLDFGIAKIHAAPSDTSTNLILGTPSYISPEQITGFSAVTASADLYSLGVVAFEMLTGAVPFKNPEPVALLMMHINEPPPRPRDRNPALPENLAAIVLRLLEKLPGRRHATAGELAVELRAVQRGL